LELSIAIDRAPLHSFCIADSFKKEGKVYKTQSPLQHKTQVFIIGYNGAKKGTLGDGIPCQGWGGGFEFHRPLHENQGSIISGRCGILPFFIVFV